MHAIVYMQPLDARGRPYCPTKVVGTVPRDGVPHRVHGTFDLDKNKEPPRYVRVYADGAPERGGVFPLFPIDKALDRATLVQDLTVLPR